MRKRTEFHKIRIAGGSLAFYCSLMWLVSGRALWEETRKCRIKALQLNFGYYRLHGTLSIASLARSYALSVVDFGTMGLYSYWRTGLFI